MKFSDKVPTIPGWYWEKDSDGCTRIIELPYHHQWPKHWTHRKREAIQQATEDGDLDVAKKLGDLNWIIQWAGPIIPPK